MPSETDFDMFMVFWYKTGCLNSYTKPAPPKEEKHAVIKKLKHVFTMERMKAKAKMSRAVKIE
jgi:hypothetical protein